MNCNRIYWIHRSPKSWEHFCIWWVWFQKFIIRIWSFVWKKHCSTLTVCNLTHTECMARQNRRASLLVTFLHCQYDYWKARINSALEASKIRTTLSLEFSINECNWHTDSKHYFTSLFVVFTLCWLYLIPSWKQALILFK